MTAVIDPGGTPVVIFNRSGTALVEVMATGNSQGAAAEIPHFAGTTIVRVTPDGDPSTNRAVKLPALAEIGDIVEVYPASALTPGPKVCAPSSVYMNETLNGDVTFSLGSGFVSFRKVEADRWVSSRT